MNDECADKIADNRYAIENSRDWLVNDGGIVDRVHRMSAKTVSFVILFYFLISDSLHGLKLSILKFKAKNSL